MSPKTIIFYERFSNDTKRCRKGFVGIDYGKLQSSIEEIVAFRSLLACHRENGVAVNDLAFQPHDHEAHYGGGVFEGIRAKPRAVEIRDDKFIAASPLELAVINGQENAQRFLRSMEALRLRESKIKHELPSEISEFFKPYDSSKDIFVPETFTSNHVLDVLAGVVQRNTHAGHLHPEKGEIYLRPLAFRASHVDGKLGVNPRQHDILFIVMAQEWGDYLPNGLNLVVYPQGVESPMRRVKASANYALGQIAKNDAVVLGFDDALFTDNHSLRYIEEATGANFFAMKDRTIVTPPLEQYVLPGITRQTAITLAHNMGYDMREEDIPLHQLARYECVFLSGTATGLRSVRLVYDQEKKQAYTFNPEHEPFRRLQYEFGKLINGMDVLPQNRELQEQVRHVKVKF